MADKLPIGANVKILGTTPGLSGSADVSDEMGRAGMSFGKLVETTGKAVADTQLKLNQTGAAMASALATTQVDVIAVQESVYDDNGVLSDAKSHTRKLPLINFIDPVFYEWSEVRLQGQFFATEFVSSTESASHAHSSSETYVGTGISFFLGPGGLGGGSTTTDTSSDVDTSRDTSYGRIRASALLTPKRDIGVPAPRQVVRGPSITLIQGEIKDVMTGAKLTGRTMSVLLELRKMDGQAIQGKTLAIETDGVAWSFTAPDKEETDANGQVAIVLQREFLTDEDDRSPINVVVSARLGFVSSSTTVVF